MNELLNDDVKQQVREAFGGLQHPVQVLFFGANWKVRLSSQAMDPGIGLFTAS
jgi:hypothetical protein